MVGALEIIYDSEKVCLSISGLWSTKENHCCGKTKRYKRPPADTALGQTIQPSRSHKAWHYQPVCSETSLLLLSSLAQVNQTILISVILFSKKLSEGKTLVMSILKCSEEGGNTNVYD